MRKKRRKRKERERVKLGIGAQSASKSKSQKWKSNQKCPTTNQDKSLSSSSQVDQCCVKISMLIIRQKSAEWNGSSQAILVKSASLPRNGHETRTFVASRASSNLDLKGSDFLERSNGREIPIQTPLRFSDTLQIPDFIIWIHCYHLVMSKYMDT